MFNENEQMLLQEDKQRIEKWSYLLEGVGEGYDEQSAFTQKRQVSRLLETQSAYLQQNIVNEDTLTSDVAVFKKYALPLIRRIYPTLPINDLVGIQPLTGPSGLIFTMEAKYTNNKAPQSAGDTIYDNATETYASQKVEGETWRAAASSSTTYAGTLGWKPVVPSTLTVTIDSVVGTDDGEGAITGTGISSGTINYNTGEISITLDSGATVAATATYEYNNEANTQIPEIELDITETPVVAKSRKLRAKWSPEVQQDLGTVHGVDGETTFVSEIAAAIQREISRAVVELCRDNVPSGQKKSWALTRPDYISYDEHKRTLVDTLIAVSRLIGNATRRGKGNVLVVSNDASDIIETMPGFRPESAENSTKVGGRLGTLNSRWTVLEDIDMATDKILIGYKGASFMDTGVVYAPYIALMLETLVNPDDFKVRKGFMTRDALKAINGKFYAEVSITGTKVYS